MKNPYRKKTNDEMSRERLTRERLFNAFNALDTLSFEKLSKFQNEQPENYSKLLEKCAVKVASKYLLNSNYEDLEFRIMLGTYKLMAKKLTN